jgi:ubiquinone/menaquinone biosynthesis C-methylase UbiE
MDHHHHGHEFDYDRMAEMREKTIDVQSVIDFMHIKQGERIADVGSGDGYYSMLLAPKCSKVYSIDISKNGIERENKKIKEKKILNVETILEDMCKMEKIPEVDRVFFSTSFHDFPCMDEIIQKFSQKNKPVFTLLEFKKDSTLGPPSEIKLSPELNAIFSRNNYVRSDIKFFDHHYIANYSFHKSTN